MTAGLRPGPPADRPVQASIVVWGAGGHAKVVAETARRVGWRIEGFIDDVRPERAGEAFCGATVLGGRAVLAALRERSIDAVVLAFGANAARLALAAELVAAGWRFPVLLDPAALVADGVDIGAGSFVGAAAIIQPGSRLGAQCIVNTGALVEHDALVAAGVHLGPRSCLAGHVSVGEGSFVGTAAVVRDHVRIGAGVAVGMGSVVLIDLPDGAVAYGHPARIISRTLP